MSASVVVAKPTLVLEEERDARSVRRPGAEPGKTGWKVASNSNCRM
jgi:hypothetical protein